MLTTLFYELAARPAEQTKLRAALLSLAEPDGTISFTALEQCGQLTGCINEIFRCVPGIDPHTVIKHSSQAQFSPSSTSQHVPRGAARRRHHWRHVHSRRNRNTGAAIYHVSRYVLAIFHVL